MEEYLFLFGVRSRTNEHNRIRSAAYFEAGGGLLRNTFRLQYFGSQSGSIDKFGFAAQGGLMMLLADHLAVDLTASLNYKPGFTSETESGGLLLGVLAGVMIYR